jgi:hypothetical protein
MKRSRFSALLLCSEQALYSHAGEFRIRIQLLDSSRNFIYTHLCANHHNHSLENLSMKS